jgi:hypothetical protein
MPDTLPDARTEAVLSEVADERDYQRSLWPQGYDMLNRPNDWGSYIIQYLGAALTPYTRVTPGENAAATFRQKMLKVAALAVAAIEACDKHVELETIPEAAPTA